MFAGHIGAGLALARFERRVNAGVFITAALLLDIVLWALVLGGREAVAIPADFATSRQPKFTFPLSHGLVASLAWSALAGLLLFAGAAGQVAARARAAVLVAGSVFSHWLLDALVHRPELPIAGGLVAGLGLWDQLPVALAVEGAIVVGGLIAFLAGSHLPRGRSIGLAVLALLCLAFTVVGMTKAPAPPSAQAMASSSLITLAIVCTVAGLLGRRSPPA